jgi:hypothetical protein
VPPTTRAADLAAAIPARVHRQRLRAQLLTEPDATDPVTVVERLLAVQAQDPRGFRLAIRSRSAVASVAAVDRAITVDRSLVVDWLCRGTLHLVRAEDHAWLHALTTPQLRAANRRRLAQEGVSPEQAARGVDVIARAVREEPRTRGRLRELLDSAGVPTANQALVHVLGAAAFDGACLRGPVVDGEQAFVHPEAWLGPRPAVDLDAALTLLARRYLTGHGPASDRDLATWAGIGLRAARRGLALLGPSLVTRAGDLVALEDVDVDALPSPRLLGAFDPALHGWADRSFLLGEAEPGVVTSNGLFRPVALVDGVAVATWRLAGGVVSIEPFAGAPLAREVGLALQTEAERVTAYLGGGLAPGAARVPIS